MENESVWESIVTAFENLINQVIDATPRIIAAIVVMVIGVFVASLLARLTKRVINFFERNKYVQQAEASAGLAGTLSKLAGRFVYWVVFVIFFSAAVNVLELQTLSNTIDGIVAYTPNIFAAVFVFAIAYLGSVILRDLVVATLKEVRFPMAKGVGILVQTLILVFGAVTAVAQLGLDVVLLNNTVIVIVGGLVLAIAIAFGLGGRSVAGSFISGLANKSRFQEGQKVSFDGKSYKVKSVNYTSVVLDSRDGDLVVSYEDIVQ